MKRIYTVIIVLITALFTSHAQNPIINRSVTSPVFYDTERFEKQIITPVHPPFVYENISNRESEISSNHNYLFTQGDMISEDSIRFLLKPSEYTYFIIDTKNRTVKAEAKSNLLNVKSVEAISLSPKWLEDELTNKLNLLHNFSQSIETEYAQMIIDAPLHLRDEVAFAIANMSLQSLTDSRFMQDKKMILRNAEFIYLIDDSLSYVNLVEYSDMSNRNYFTTTKYRIYDPIAKDTIWSEIPKEIYYWYIVHPKMDQEGVYVVDNSNDASGQRTFGYSWREFIWNNPDPNHDYRNVNITTSKGTVSTIPRFADMIKQAGILWDRNKTYYVFNRPMLPGNSALDLIGNWCSRALPVDVTLPRAFQPNQILMKHNGMCNEDAFLVAAACRTALIPIIYLGTWCEDHVFGSIYDNDWNHFEFFRGGLSETGNQFYGITNMLPRGSYGWKNSMVEGFRPDGLPINFTTYYANTCGLSVRVLDKNGNPIDGVKLIYYASPNAYNSNYVKSGTAYTNPSGYAEIRAGEQKKYLVQAYHPKFGWSPADSTQAYYLTSVNSVANMIYRVNISYPNAAMPDLVPEIVNDNNPKDFSVILKYQSQDVLSATNDRDSQRSKFYLWNTQNSKLLSMIICDSVNFEFFREGKQFQAIKCTGSGQSESIFNIPENTKWYVVLSNHKSTVYLQNISASLSLHDYFVSVKNEANIDFNLSPNPFSEYIDLNSNENFRSVRVFDLFGRLIEELNYPDRTWYPDNIPQGVYTFVMDTGKRIITRTAICIQN